MRIVLDTNVFISALVSTQAPPAAILDLWRAEEIELLVSLDVLAEYERVLSYPKIRKRLQLAKGDIDEILELIATQGVYVEPNSHLQSLSVIQPITSSLN